MADPTGAVDLRSDTVTRPTAAMRRAMAEAEVGDAGRGEDPTVNALQAEAAELLGKADALFLPSGTMSNQIALRVLARPGEGVVVGAHQHIVVREDTGPTGAGVRWLPVDDTSGVLDPAAVDLIASDTGSDKGWITMIAIEDTHAAAGGIAWPASDLRTLADVAASHGLAVHLDGARLWNAAVASGESVAARVASATTVACCLSKGLAAPVGSLLAGPADVIEAARDVCRRLGGTMRQAGVLAAAGIVALRHMRGRLAEDHARAARLAVAVAERWPGIDFDPTRVRTNIVTFEHPSPTALLAFLRDHGVIASATGPGRVRLVTHLDVNDDDIERACWALAHSPT